MIERGEQRLFVVVVIVAVAAVTLVVAAVEILAHRPDLAQLLVKPLRLVSLRLDLRAKLRA